MDEIPIHCSQVQTKRHPAFGPDIGRHVKADRIPPYKKVLIARMGFATQGNPAIAMMIVQEPGEGFLADSKCKVLVARGFDFRQRFAELYQALAQFLDCCCFHLL